MIWTAYLKKSAWLLLSVQENVWTVVQGFNVVQMLSVLLKIIVLLAFAKVK